MFIVYRFQLNMPAITWDGNLTHPYQIRYAYIAQTINPFVEE
jgi:hypothetical protein